MTDERDIALEAALLKNMSNKIQFRQFYDVLDKKRLIPVTANLLQDYKKYFDKYDSDINWETFYTEFAYNWHKKDLDEHDLSYYRKTVFPIIQNATIPENLYNSLVERESHHKLQEALTNGESYESLTAIINEAKEKLNGHNKKDEDVFNINELDLSVLDVSKGLSWFLPSLQANINSLMPGQFIVVSADSGAGKSAFCISQAVHVFQQLHNTQSLRPILYCTSEDTKEDLAGRFLSNLYKDKCKNGFEEIVEKFNKVKNNFISTYNTELFIAMQIKSSNDMSKIRQKIDKYNPSIIIIDMLDKLSASDNVMDLTKLYQDVRSIANEGYPIIGTSQSGNTAYWDNESKEYKHRKWLTDKDLIGSKSGKQGAAYCMIMIGQDDGIPDIRYLSTTKKKRGKHCNVTCRLTEKFSEYKELI